MPPAPRTPDYGSEEQLKRLITDAGFVPVRTTASYETK